ncbi:YceD family protein [Sessilibacter sp. MAH4]|mgnify:CR=1 FL=1
MNERTIRNSIPRFIDARKLAQKDAVIEGNVIINSLDRLSELAHNQSDVITVTFAFDIDDHGYIVIQGEIKSEIALTCQRCLEPMIFPIDTSVNIAVVRDQEAAKQLPKSLDPWIVESESADLYELIEEEILLEVPIAPFHEHQCIPENLFSSGEKPKEIPKTNPFSVLEQLKGSSSKSD